MSADWLGATLAWVTAHPLLASAAVFAAALAESLFLFGLIVPGAFFMFVAGALVGAGALALLPTLLWAMAGALVGDALSFALGNAYRGDLHRFRLLRRFPNLIQRGEAFFQRHGGKGIILGRFLGPLRPVMPTVAGAAGMRIPAFVAIDVIATIGWAPCYILPGVVFGASLDLAAQVASRLALMLVLVVAIIWFLLWAARWLLASGSAWGRGHTERLLNWSRRHRTLGLLGPALADPRQPETPALGLLAMLLMGVTWTAYSLAWGWQATRYPTQLDALVYRLTADLHTPWTDFIALSFSQLGSPIIYAPLAAAALAGLILLGNYRAAVHFMAGTVFAAAVGLALRWRLAVEAPASYFADERSYFAGGHMLVAATIYGFLGAILASRRFPATRQLYYSGFITLVALIGLARLYLGLDWLTDIAIGLGIAFLWISILTLGYRRQRPRPVRPRALFALLVAALAAAVVWQGLRHIGATMPAEPEREAKLAVVENWQTRGYSELPARTIDLVGRAGSPLNIQIAGRLDAIAIQLAAAGWAPAVLPAADNFLLWLSPGAPISALPVLPLVHDGKAPSLTLYRPISSGSQLILRLWPTARVVAETGRAIWVGQVSRQQIVNRFGLLRLPGQTGGYDIARTLLGASLVRGVRVVSHPAASPAPRWDGRVLLLAASGSMSALEQDNRLPQIRSP